MIDVRGITKAFGPTRVLRGVDLHIADGSLTAVLGASGGGKTTLLRIIAGLEHADAGTVEVGGGVGYVPQDAVLFPHLTVAGNVTFGVHRRHRHSSRIDDLIGLVGLGGLEDRYPHQLSGGQQHRVALARALAIDPALVLLDEPFASLDASLRATVRAEVCAILRATGTTAVLVTHDQDEALSVADHVAVLRDGIIVQQGPPAELYRAPVDADVAAFVGDANLIPAMVHDAVAVTPLGALGVRGGSADGAALVLIRPEQISIGAPGAGVVGVVQTCEYFGHDAMLRIDAGAAGTYAVRVNGADALAPGTSVGLGACGPVTAWAA